MKTLTSLIVMACVATPVYATDTAVSIAIGEPGFYGVITLGNAPPPVLIYAEPIVVIHSRTVGPPLYMRVPPGHAMHWKDHCAAYGACGRPVYFVQDTWYHDVYAPHYRKHHGKGKGKGKGGGKGNGKGHD